jgi:hypothetical protein
LLAKPAIRELDSIVQADDHDGGVTLLHRLGEIADDMALLELAARHEPRDQG